MDDSGFRIKDGLGVWMVYQVWPTLFGLKTFASAFVLFSVSTVWLSASFFVELNVFVTINSVVELIVKLPNHNLWFSSCSHVRGTKPSQDLLKCRRISVAQCTR